MPIVAAPQARGWMDRTSRRYAYRCLPVLMANQAGWFILNSHNLSVRWDGGNELQALTISGEAGAELLPASSHFGNGILTWHVPYLFRTSPGYNLLVRGPANMPKGGAVALEGIVETDWAVATFTVNWQITHAGADIEFAKDEPICMFAPIKRAELERFTPRIRRLGTDADLASDYRNWSTRRDKFLEGLAVPGSLEERRGWERDYFLGLRRDSTFVEEHQTKLRLRPFERE